MKIGISMIYKRVDDSAPNRGTFALECEAVLQFLPLTKGRCRWG